MRTLFTFVVFCVLFACHVVVCQGDSLSPQYYLSKNQGVYLADLINELTVVYSNLLFYADDTMCICWGTLIFKSPQFGNMSVHLCGVDIGDVSLFKIKTAYFLYIRTFSSAMSFAISTPQPFLVCGTNNFILCICFIDMQRRKY